MYYYFAQNGEVLYALKDDEYANEYQAEKINKVKNFFNTHAFANAKAFKGCESILTQDPVLRFTFGTDNSTTINIETTYPLKDSNEHEGLDLKNPSKALLVAKVVTLASKNAVDAGSGAYQSDLARINFFADGNNVGSICFTEPNTIFKSTIASLPAGEKPLKLSVSNESNQTLIVEAAIYPYRGVEEKEVINQFDGDRILKSSVEINNTIWNEPKKCNIYLNETPIENVEFTYRDYMLTLISYFKTPASFTAWYNDAKNAIAGCSLSSLKYKFNLEDEEKSFNEIRYAILQKDINRNTVRYSFVDGSNLKTVTEATNYDDEVTPFVKLDSYFRPVSQQDESGIVTAYSYDAYGNCTQQKVYPSSDTSKYIIQNYTYTNGDQLASEKTYKELSTNTTSYNYDEDGKLIKVTTPKGQVINYTHPEMEGYYSTMQTTLNGENLANRVLTQKGLLSSVDSCNQDINFNYDKFDNVSSVTQGNNFIFQKNVSYNADGSGYVTITYPNNYSEEQHFDKYGHVNQIIKKENGVEKERFIKIYSDNELSSSVKTLDHEDIILSANSKLRKVVDKNGVVVYNCEYDQLGNVSEIEDENNVIQYCVADNLGRLITQIITEDNAVSVARNLTYKDDSSGIISQEDSVVEINGVEKGELQTDYSKDGLNRPTSTTVKDGNNGYKLSFEYYPKQRQEQVLVQKPSLTPGVILPPTYKTVTVDDGTTGYMKTVTTTDIVDNVEGAYKKETITYDANGNITNIENKLYNAGGVLQSTSVNSYEYDNLNRLTRENNADLGKSFTHEYDIHGNLTAKKEYAYTTGSLGTVIESNSFTYDNSNKLTKINENTVSYGLASNNISGVNGKTFTWKGNKISSVADSRGNSTISYYPNGAVKDIVFEENANFNDYNLSSRVFSYINGQLHCESLPFCKLYYVYNEQGIAGFYLSNKPACYFFKEGLYTFRKNLFGDITDIYYGDTPVASYKYDAWGNCTVENSPLEGTDEDFLIGNINPFRYRGYYWCEALQMYHLQTRWYDPTMCRFISPDSYEYLDTETFGGLNLYAYCNNDPVNKYDPTGHFAIATAVAIGFWIGFGIGALAGATAGGIIAYEYCVENDISGWRMVGLMSLGILGGGYLGGAIGGAIGSAIGYGVGIAFGGTQALAEGASIALYSGGGSSAAFDAAVASGKMLIRETFAAKTLTFAQTIYPILKLKPIYNTLWGKLSYDFALGASSAEI